MAKISNNKNNNSDNTENQSENKIREEQNDRNLVEVHDCLK